LGLDKRFCWCFELFSFLDGNCQKSKGSDLTLRWKGGQGKVLFRRILLGAAPFEKAAAGRADEVQQRHPCEEDGEDCGCDDKR
jgi:hypothetical protein